MLSEKIRIELDKIIVELANNKLFEQSYRSINHFESINIGVRRRSAIKSALFNMPKYFFKGQPALQASYLERGINQRFNLCPYGLDNEDETVRPTPQTIEQTMAFANLSTQQIYDTLLQEQNDYISPANPTGESAMSTVSVVEKVLLIDGQPASKLTDMQLVSKLSALQGNIKFLSETDTGSKKIASMIEAAKSQIRLIVDELDSRE